MLVRYYSKLENEIKKVIEQCESPIEELLLLKIIEYVLIKSVNEFDVIRKSNQNFKLYLMSELTNKDGKIWELDEPSDGYNLKYFIRIYYSGYDVNMFDRYIDIIPQHKVFYLKKNNSTSKNYFVLDFGIFLKESKTDKLIRKFCIECDGYKFHSEKEQIIKDNNRSRKLLVKENDFTTIRYLGREINGLGDDDLSELLDVLFQEKGTNPILRLVKKN